MNRFSTKVGYSQSSGRKEEFAQSMPGHEENEDSKAGSTAGTEKKMTIKALTELVAG